MRQGVLAGAAIAAVGWGTGAAQGAMTTYDVTLDTSSFAADAVDQPFSLFLALSSGGTPGVANTVSLSNFTFGAGGSAGAIDGTTGDETGDLSSTVTLDTVNGGFNSLQQNFTPGQTLSFQISTTDDGVDPTQATPDGLAIDIFDQAGVPVPTLDPSGNDSLLTVTYGLPLDVEAFASDPSRTTTGLATVTFAAPAVSAVPEPSAAALAAGLALAALGGQRRRSRRVPAQP